MRWVALLALLLLPLNGLAEDWMAYKSEDGVFSIKFPAEPVRKQHGAGSWVVQTMDAATSSSFAVQSEFLGQDVPQSLAKNALMIGRDSAVKTHEGKLIDDIEISSQGSIGRQFVCLATKDDVEFVLQFRVFVVDQHLIQMWVSSPAKSQINIKTAAEFFGSFRDLNAKSESQTDSDPIAGVEFGKWAVDGNLSFRISSAAIERVQAYRTIYQDTIWSDKNFLIVRVDIKNTDERKVARLKPNTFKSPILVLDDVKNAVRWTRSDATTRFVGQLTADDDIAPETTRTTLAVFDVPLPKTKYLTAVVQLEEFYDHKGLLLLTIPREKIANFK